MASISTADIKKLREATGAGMVDCKNALAENDGDYDKVVEYLRIKGLKGVAKREGRAASNGLVTVKADGTGKATLLELNCETDFVAKGERFIALAEQVVAAASAVSANEPKDIVVDGKDLQTVLDDANAMLGEKIEVRRVATLEGAYVGVYLHKTNPDLPPQLGVLVELDKNIDEVSPSIAKDVAQHIAAFAPQFTNRDEVSEEAVAKEREIARATALEEGKPEAALDKIVEGRVTGFFKEAVLVEQAFAKDNKKTVGKVLDEAGVGVVRFARFKVGQA
ncbi:MAG TPA: translation elongation factor Ts [Mycobacteriales bacterium]|nr:translation elongation factor Ts [Mycobacteriales bacterium]